MDPFQDKIKPRSRPVSAIISTTTTNVTSYNHGTHFSPTSATSVTSNVSDQTSQAQPTSTSNHLLQNASSTSEPLKLLSRAPVEKESRKSPMYITKKDILKNELRTGTTSGLNDSNHDRKELQFLVSIYSPGLRPLHHTSLVDRLKSRLPKIVENNTDVNLSLHLFLATIMVQFVNSWYLTKLNTNNLEFLKTVYDDILVVLVRDIAKRIGAINSFDLLHVADDLMSILNTHLTELVGNVDGKYPYKVIDDYYSSAERENNLYYDSSKDPKDVLQMYLAQKHLIFDHSNEPNEEQLSLYLRVMVKEILRNVMQNNAKDSVFTSKITSDLLVLIVGDLVMNRLLQKVSSSKFLLGSINKFVTKSLMGMKERNKGKEKTSQKSSQQSLITTIMATAYTICEMILTLVLSIRVSSGYAAPFDVIKSSIFLLLGTLFALRETKPLVYTLVVSVKYFILSIPWLKNGINNVGSTFATDFLNTILTAEAVHKVIDELRIQLFYSDRKDTGGEDEIVSVDIVADNVAELFNHFPIGKQYCPDRNRIKQVLIVFDRDEELDPNNNTNQYLVIKMFDRIVHAAYNDI
ncbi:hypothetical protein CANMA_003703 [Candida margitis]|uniref:uncharacterized protein n=1 Tax=Candida margitis TaxID=1775924 RepID=UPI0022270A60|nr:uncharacterized protein CANMA_003703 [Candida margitis]KAI5961726.1 hypothetical protein CANMA_003703 [Candida margitis]